MLICVSMYWYVNMSLDVYESQRSFGFSNSGFTGNHELLAVGSRNETLQEKS